MNTNLEEPATDAIKNAGAGVSEWQNFGLKTGLKKVSLTEMKTIISGHTTLDIRQLPSFSASGHHLHLLCRTDIQDFLQDCRLLQEMRMVVWSLPVPLYISLYVAIITLALDSWSSTRRVTKGTTRAKICVEVTLSTIRFKQ